MHNTKKYRRGFTLVEIMAATAIMVVVIMFVTNIAVDMLRAYDGTISAISSNYDARSVLDPIETDFVSAKVFNDNHRWFEVRYDENDTGNLDKTSAPRIMLFAQPKDRVRRSINAGTSTEIQGDMCAICYRLVQKAPFGTSADSPENARYSMYRSILNAKDTGELAIPYIIGSNGKSGSAENQTPNSFWSSSESITDPSDDKKYSLSEWTTEIQNLLVDGVLDLTLIFWYDDYDDSGKRKIAIINNPRIAQYVRSAYKNNYDVTTFSTSIAAGYDKIVFDSNVSGAVSGALKAVDVSVTVLSPEGKSRLSGLQRQESSQTISDDEFTDLLQEYGVTFTRSFTIFREE
ncbi:MAG: prepilin-type N-terminal cleavage/methylation domain-containing protein [Opitutae bacterium]|nr:prepilin-type N-terminal cleavage/methylation domain-containing protein [Opitutae bacterium]